MSFTIFYNKKTTFQAIKRRSLKSSKVDTFPQGLTHGFGPKMPIFSTVFFRQHRPGKWLLRYSTTKKRPFQIIKGRCSKRRKIDIFPKGLTHGFGRIMDIFPTFFLQTIQGRKMSFTIFQNEKTPFQTIKRTSSKSRKIDIFPKALTHGFDPKRPFLQLFFFSQYRLGECLLRYSTTKISTFQAIKIRSLKS